MKTRYVLPILLTAFIVLLSDVSFAGDDNGPKFGGEQKQGQLQGQAQGQILINDNASSSVSNSAAVAASHSDGSSAVTGASNSQADGGSIGDINVETNAEKYAPSAPTIYANLCQNGVSGSGYAGSAGIVSADIVCEHYKVAQQEIAAYRLCVEQEVPCTEEVKLQHLANYNKSMETAQAIVENLSPLATASKGAGYLVLPAALIWGLLLL
jgi:hypothetical protein